MFVPRQVKRPKASTPAVEQERRDDQDEPPAKKRCVSGPRFAPSAPTTELYEQLICGVELIFSDYAYGHEESLQWLRNHYRQVGGEGRYIHLSALLSHDYLSTLKPTPTQPVLRQALQRHIDKEEESLCLHLELAKVGYYVRRCDSLPVKLSSQDRDERHWHDRTVYVEPHLSTLCATPAKLVWYLKKHWKSIEAAQLGENFGPVQHVDAPKPGYAFLILSGAVTDLSKQEWQRLWPGDWIVLTKAEHARRTQEYVELLEASKSSTAASRPAPNNTVSKASSASRWQDHAQLVEQPKPKAYPTAGKLLSLANVPLATTPAALTSWIARTTHRYRTRGSKVSLPSGQNVGVAYVDFPQGATVAIVRMRTAEEADMVVRAVGARGKPFAEEVRDGGTRDGTAKEPVEEGGSDERKLRARSEEESDVPERPGVEERDNNDDARLHDPRDYARPAVVAKLLTAEEEEAHWARTPRRDRRNKQHLVLGDEEERQQAVGNG